MQFKTILASGLLLLGSHLFAQNHLPLPASFEKMLQQRAPAAAERMKHLFRHTAQPAPGIEARGNAPKLDSTVLYTGYSFLNDTFPLAKAEYAYPAPQVTVITEFAHFDQWVPNGRVTQTRDQLDRTIEMQGEVYDFDSGDWLSESRVHVFPHGNSMELVDSMIVETWDPELEVWITMLATTTSFDDQSRPVATLSYVNFGGFEFALLDEHYYDANGDNYLIEQSVYEDGVWGLYNIQEIEYVQHREMRRATFAVDGESGTMFPTDVLETAYDANGNIVRTEAYEFDFFTFDWVLAELTEYGYDNQNRLIFVQNEDFTTNGPLPNRTDYTYLDGINLAVETYSEQDPATQTWVVLEKTFYYYSGTTSSRDVVIGESLLLSPNPTTGFVRLPVSADALVSVVGLNGISLPVAQSNRANGQIDLSNLPAGIYYITVQEGLERRVGKVVKQ